MDFLRPIRRAIRGPIIRFLAGDDLVIVGDVWGSTTAPALIQVTGDRWTLIIGNIVTHDEPYVAIVPRGCKPAWVKK